MGARSIVQINWFHANASVCSHDSAIVHRDDVDHVDEDSIVDLEDADGDEVSGIVDALDWWLRTSSQPGKPPTVEEWHADWSFAGATGSFEETENKHPRQQSSVSAPAIYQVMKW